MYSYLELTDYDKIFRDDPEAFPIVCDHRAATMKNQASQYFNNLFLTASKANLTFIASCNCGKLKGNYCIDSICPYCKTKCTVNYDEISFRAWLEIPDELTPVPHPVLYRVLHKYLKRVNGVPLIDLLLDSSIEVELPEEMRGIIGRGMKYFHDNFYDIMNYFMMQYSPFQRKTHLHNNRNLQIFLKKYNDVLFVKHLPVLNSNLHLITEQASLKRSDSSAPNIFEAIIELSALTHNIRHSPKSEEYFDQQFYSVYAKYLEYIRTVMEDKLISKEGLIRKHLLGVRCHYTSRAVIVPIVTEHRCDEVHIPWAIGVTSYKLEIINILLHRYDYTLPDAMEKVTKSLTNFDEDIYKILNILIDECPYSGLPKQLGLILAIVLR